MKFKLLSTTDRQIFQADYVVTVDYTDLIGLANGNTGSFKLAPYGGGDGVVQPFTDVASPPTFAAGTILGLKAVILDTPFVFSDASITANGVVVGDGGSSNRYLASIETIGTGSFVTYSIGTATKFMLTSADSLIAAFTGTAAHNLNTATAGSIRFFLRAEDTATFPTG